MTDYITSSQLKNTLAIDDTYADTDVATAITSASRVIDAYKSTRFYSTTETRLYTAETPFGSVAIYDLNMLTTLKIDNDGDGTYETTLTRNTDFYLEPINADLTGKPWNAVTLRELSGRQWPTCQYGIQIIGSFGWSTAPIQVTQATTILAGRYLKRARETPYGILTIGTDALHAARLGKLDPDVAVLLDSVTNEEAPTLIL